MTDIKQSIGTAGCILCPVCNDSYVNFYDRRSIKEKGRCTNCVSEERPITDEK